VKAKKVVGSVMAGSKKMGGMTASGHKELAKNRHKVVEQRGLQTGWCLLTTPHAFCVITVAPLIVQDLQFTMLRQKMSGSRLYPE
jgi:hypothetical protein